MKKFNSKKSQGYHLVSENVNELDGETSNNDSENNNRSNVISTISTPRDDHIDIDSSDKENGEEQTESRDEKINIEDLNSNSNNNISQSFSKSKREKDEITIDKKNNSSIKKNNSGTFNNYSNDHLGEVYLHRANNQLLQSEEPNVLSFHHLDNNLGDGIILTDHNLIDDTDSTPHEISLLKLIALTISFLGVQFGWALQIAYSTPLFLELGVPSYFVSLIWMAGPISGLLVQPIVGVISDRLECRHGRRRPFIFFGTFFIVVGLMLISNASSIGAWFGDTKADKTVSILTAIIGFWILDLSNNTVQAPCRALLVDVAAPSQQGLGSSLFSIMLGIGNLLGYLIGSIHLTGIFPFMKTDIRALFTLSSIVLVICITITLLFIKEAPYRRPLMEDRQNAFKQIFQGIRNMPPYLVRVCFVQFFSWIGWFCFILYVTTWVGVDVYQGDPNAPEGSLARNNFQEGVRRGSLGLTVSSAVSIITSLLLPVLIRMCGLKTVYFIGNMIQTICFALFLVVKDKLSCLFLIGATGIPWAVVMVLPFTLVGMGSSSAESGFHMGGLNIFVVIPQLLVSLGISFVIRLFHDDVVSSLITGSIASIIATVLVFGIIVPHGDLSETSINDNDAENDENTTSHNSNNDERQNQQPYQQQQRRTINS